MNTSAIRIGISANLMHADPSRTIYNGRRLLYLEQSMADWIYASKQATPLLLPFGQDPQEVQAQAQQLVATIDALVLHGGADVCPRSYDQEPLRPEWEGDATRDAQEIALVHACIKQDIPILGVCRGMQLLNVALGGSLYQDINHQRPNTLTHRDAALYQRNHHGVILSGELAKQFGQTTGKINSVHHQAVDRLAPGLQIEARCAEDQTVEAIRRPRATARDPYVMGVQWHPEFQSPHETTLLSPSVIFNDLIEAIRARRS